MRSLGEFFLGALSLTSLIEHSRHLTLLVNVSARADVAEKIPITSFAGNANVINPAIFAVVPPQPILHTKMLPGIEVPDVNF